MSANRPPDSKAAGPADATKTTPRRPRPVDLVFIPGRNARRPKKRSARPHAGSEASASDIRSASNTGKQPSLAQPVSTSASTSKSPVMANPQIAATTALIATSSSPLHVTLEKRRSTKSQDCANKFGLHPCSSTILNLVDLLEEKGVELESFFSYVENLHNTGIVEAKVVTMLAQVVTQIVRARWRAERDARRARVVSNQRPSNDRRGSDNGYNDDESVDEELVADHKGENGGFKIPAHGRTLCYTRPECMVEVNPNETPKDIHLGERWTARYSGWSSASIAALDSYKPVVEAAQDAAAACDTLPEQSIRSPTATGTLETTSTWDTSYVEQISGHVQQNGRLEAAIEREREDAPTQTTGSSIASVDETTAHLKTTHNDSKTTKSHNLSSEEHRPLRNLPTSTTAPATPRKYQQSLYTQPQSDGFPSSSKATTTSESRSPLAAISPNRGSTRKRKMTDVDRDVDHHQQIDEYVTNHTTTLYHPEAKRQNRRLTTLQAPPAAGQPSERHVSAFQQVAYTYFDVTGKRARELDDTGESFFEPAAKRLRISGGGGGGGEGSCKGKERERVLRAGASGSRPSHPRVAVYEAQLRDRARDEAVKVVASASRGGVSPSATRERSRKRDEDMTGSARKKTKWTW